MFQETVFGDTSLRGGGLTYVPLGISPKNVRFRKRSDCQLGAQADHVDLVCVRSCCMGTTGPKPTLPTNSKCCNVVRHCGHSYIAQHFVGSDVSVRTFRIVATPPLMLSLFQHTQINAPDEFEMKTLIADPLGSVQTSRNLAVLLHAGDRSYGVAQS